MQFFSLNYLFLEVKVIAAADICFCCASVLINTIMDSSDPKKKRKQNRCFGQVSCSVPAGVEFLSFFRIFHLTSVFGLRAILSKLPFTVLQEYYAGDCVCFFYFSYYQ